MTWQHGADRIRSLLDTGELERVTPDPAVARRLLTDPGRHLTTANSAIADTTDADLAGGYQLAYDALRKSVAALLAAQGLRATSRVGHVAVQDAAAAQFGRTVRAFKAFGRIRRARNSFEYPDTDTGGPNLADVHDALTVARQALDAAKTILDQDVLTPW
ncbi:MAG TPA: hypothetical protein VIC62_03530 [Nakamurella sp.]|jgi:hypothetical protein